VASARIFRSLHFTREKAILSRGTEGAGGVRQLETDTNAAVVVTVIGSWNNMTVYYPAFSLEAIVAMTRESEEYVDK